MCAWVRVDGCAGGWVEEGRTRKSLQRYLRFKGKCNEVKRQGLGKVKDKSDDTQVRNHLDYRVLR